MQAIYLDIESTGLDPIKHRTIDIAFKVIDVTSQEEIVTYSSIVKVTPEAWARRDPTSIEINGYTWDEVSLGKDVSIVSYEIIELFTQLKIERGKAVFICQNPAFDRGFFNQIVDVYTQERLMWPYHWLDLASMYWGLIVQKCVRDSIPFPAQISLSKNEIAKVYNLPPENSPHRAIKGVEHLIQCYEAVLGVKFKAVPHV